MTIQTLAVTLSKSHNVLLSCYEYYRVEGLGSATILDVTYFTRELETDKSNHDDNSYMAVLQCVADKEREIKHTHFQREAVEKQKDMLKRFASYITNFESEGDKVQCM